MLALSAPAASAALLSASSPPSATASAFEIGHIPRCIQAVPAALGLGRDDVRLDVLVLTDGVTPAQAAPVMDVGARAYTPLGITLAVTFREVAFTRHSALGLVEQAVAAVGGRRPAGVDVVHVIRPRTSRSWGPSRWRGRPPASAAWPSPTGPSR